MDVDRPPLDAESADWVRVLTARGPEHEVALARLHERLQTIARHEMHRRSGASRIPASELSDLAHQAADDAMIAILDKLGTFRGESRFTTWAYRFVVLEVSNKLARHYRHHPPITLDAEHWEQLPDRFGLDPGQYAESRDLIAAVRRAVDERLTARQRSVFVAAVVNAVPLDVLAMDLDVTRGAVYKALFDARRKLRTTLVASGYLPEEARMTAPDALSRFLTTDPADVGCDEALRLLHVYVDLVRSDRVAAEARYPGIVAHLAACGPCGDDYAALLAAASDRRNRRGPLPRRRPWQRAPRGGKA